MVHETCAKVWPGLLSYNYQTWSFARERIKHIMEKEIAAVVPEL